MGKLKQSIVLCGFMSVGKTSVGKTLAKKLNVKFVDTDDVIIEKTGKTIPEIFAESGEEVFREMEHQVAIELSKAKPMIISTGGGMLTFDRNAILFKDNAIVLCLTRDFNTLYDNLKNDTGRPMVFGKTKGEIRMLYEERFSKYLRASDYIIENDTSIADCVDYIIENVL